MSDAPFLDAAPPPLVVRAAATMLLVLFATALVLSVVLELPVTVDGRFTLVPVRGADPLRAPRAAIVAEVAVVEGAGVDRGAPLFRLRSELAGDRMGEVAALEIGARGAIAKIENERARQDRQLEADRAALRGLTRQAAALGREITLAERKAALARALSAHASVAFDERLVTYEEVQAKELEVTRADLELARLRTEQEQAESGAERLGHEIEVKARTTEEAVRALREEAERAQVRLATLRSAPVTSSGNEVVVVAPCAGTVVRLHARAAGAVVAEGEALGEIACAGEELRAEISVVDKGMGLVVPGQQAKLFYDAFPYQRHGVRYAAVRWIGPAATPKADAPAFRVLAELRDREIQVRGAPYPLLPGMTGTAEIIVARQSALAYVFEPVRALRENLGHGP
jgi:multidrug efflux pump subunit AcrA (membrane-fusion protein)